MVDPNRIKVGVLGCGTISEIYFSVKTFDILEVVACADIVRQNAEVKATKFNIAKVYNNEDAMMAG